ncbi:EAL domain-containing protein [Gordonia sp. HNM0687]|uniref:EAL domain-containing protein n=1 Tax=Gordonia mangrovi TaxID=2665643 RepID=A0A6L7GM11_9ACTN|nr:EAL domain-containing protein [Gordonia mangrovi]MXP20281.1 EAL domain-containing protein [Gordonia mangrovi]UVF79116.1 EAL domain-containing protein [Gordonia mangrovi]
MSDPDGCGGHPPVFAATVIALCTDPCHRAATAYGHATSTMMAQRFVEEVLTPLCPHGSLERRSDREWLVSLSPQDGDPEFFVRASRVRCGAHPVHIDGKTTFLDVCMGVAVRDELPEVVNHDDLVRCADAALSFALTRQRQVVFADDEMLPLVREQVEIANRLAAAQPEEFRLHYQPIVRSDDRRPVGFESLLRWYVEAEVLTPASFLPAAQATSLILPIGQHASGMAIRALAGPITSACGDTAFVSINLSAQQLWADDIVAHFGELIAASGVASHRVWIEVREDEVIKLGSAAAHAIEGLDELGCTICIDDLGAGYSALRYVRDLPVDVVKVDRSLIGGIADDESDRAVVRAICDMARATGMTSLAEGVETEEMLCAVVDLGFDLAQGYLFGKPQPASSAFEW